MRVVLLRLLPSMLAVLVLATAPLPSPALAQQPASGAAATPPLEQPAATPPEQPAAPGAAAPPAILAPGAAGDAPVLGEDLSITHMITGASAVVKAVMALLALASVATWTIILVKSVELGRLRRAAGRELAILHPAATWPQGAALRLSALLGAGAAKGVPVEAVEGRVAVAREELLQRARAGLAWLATVGSVGPFVGLFGTVWGIMNSFIGIAGSHSTNLATVAPGIAEALLATALGLVAAIPAVVAYNIFMRRLNLLRLRLDALAVEILRLVPSAGPARRAAAE